MMYLIGKLSLSLLVAVLGGAMLGWGYAARRGAPARAALRRERDGLVRDLAKLAGGEGDEAREEARLEAERAMEAERAHARIRESRIAELERALDNARGRHGEVEEELSLLRQRAERAEAEAEESKRLHARIAELEAARAAEIATYSESAAALQQQQLQTWRLRYFEQRVRYLEGLRLAAPPATPPAPQTPSPVRAAAPPTLEWRAREAEARARYLEEALRATSGAASRPTAAPSEATAEVEPFAANADVDVLLRWRLLYLERRVAHLQEERAARAAAESARAAQSLPAEPPAAVAAAPDPDRWMWRARYLEARVRHLEQRVAAASVPQAEAVQEVLTPLEPSPQATPETTDEAQLPREPSPPAHERRKPIVLTAPRNGAPDDLTLIESVSQLQQSTLYALGIFHYDQIAAWTPENIAWVDNYFRLRGRIEEEEWIEQAEALARGGPAAARRVLEEEGA